MRNLIRRIFLWCIKKLNLLISNNSTIYILNYSLINLLENSLFYHATYFHPSHNFSFQTNFLITQGLALFLASFFRSHLHPSKVSASARHAFGLLIGLFFGYFCFGHQAIHIAGLPALCYIVMLTQNPLIVQR